VETNPYQTPKFADADPARTQNSRLFLKVLAVIFWALGGIWMFFGAIASSMQVALDLYEQQPVIYITVVAYSFALPVSCWFLLGLASWRRSFRFATYGLALLVPTFVLYAWRFLTRS
jgi:hypothetical protein